MGNEIAHEMFPLSSSCGKNPDLGLSLPCGKSRRVVRQVAISNVLMALVSAGHSSSIRTSEKSSNQLYEDQD